MNDMPALKIMKRLKRGIDKTNKEYERMLIDSHVLEDNDYEAVSQDFIHMLQTPMSNSSEDNEEPVPPDPPDKLFEEQDWTYYNGKWQPPEEKPPPKIAKLSQSNNNNSQSDSGANRIVTDDITKLIDVHYIDPMPMSGCNKEDDNAIVCTAVGKLPIHTLSGKILKVVCYYSAEVDGTIISPTTIVAQLKDQFYGWMQYANYRNKTGTITLLGHDDVENEILPVVCSNDLWYHETSFLGPQNDMEAKINRLSNAARYELWHQRTAHAGSSTLEILHHHCDGVPKLKGNSFYRCPSCMQGKLATRQPIGTKTKKHQQHNSKYNKNILEEDNDEDDIFLPEAQPGQKFHMDFGFVRGADYNYKTKDGKTITSIDGKNAYLIIIDRSSRYIWVFITSDKTPPIKEARMILNKFKSTNKGRSVRVDQGGELNSMAFKEMVADEGFALELTGSDSSAQNGMAENPNRTYGQVMRCLLHASDLGPEYWSYALTHAVYIKNRLPHHSIKMTPFEKFTGRKPNLKRLRIFGSKVYSRQPGKRSYKLDHHTDGGVFLGYTATDKIVNYIDEQTGRVKTATHVIFDEAHMTTPANKAPIAAQTLQRLGYYAKEDWIQEVEDEVKEDEQKNTFSVKPLTSSATIPSRATDNSVGYDLHYDGDEHLTIDPGEIQVLSTGIAITCPINTYARIAPRSGLTVKQTLTTMAGVIDPDYTGEVKVCLMLKMLQYIGRQK